jgi:diguanylate cyclase (GGDEF)-like protein
MTKLWLRRLFIGFVLIAAAAVIFLAFRGTPSVPLRTLINAPAGLTAAGLGLEAVSNFLPNPVAPSGQCPKSGTPAVNLRTDKPTKVFEFELPPPTARGSRQVAYLQDPIAELVAFSVELPGGCRWTAASGRAFPFDQRAVVNPFPNVLLPEELPAGARVQVLIQDVKSIRPWVHAKDFEAFERLSTTIWMALAAFSTLLMAAGFIATAFTGLMRQTVVWSYVVYVVCFLFWLGQNFSMFSAGVGLWPEGPSFPLMQALAVASVVIGISFASIEFLQLEKIWRRSLRVVVTLCAAGFVSSAWFAGGYKFGAAMLALGAMAIAWALLRRLRKSDLPFKLFALGLTATMAGGATQAASILSGGGTGAYWPIFAFPLGAFLQGILWMLALVVRSETNRRTQEAQLLRDATLDPLTGLYNRRVFTDKLAAHIGEVRSRQAGRSLLMFLGLDRFKVINDSLGHQVGDDLLKLAALRLQSSAVAADCVARFGGDEFLLLVHDTATEAAAMAHAARVQAELRQLWTVAGMELGVTASIGLVLLDKAYLNAGDALRDVDTALQGAKDAGRNQTVLFDREMRDAVDLKFRIQSELDKAISSRQFELHFQPIVSLADGHHVGFEALVRWRHPVRGMVNPAQFVTIAEESGHIRALGDLIIEMALDAVAGWKVAGLWQPGWYVSINVSGGQLVDASLLTFLEQAMSARQISERDIRLELTETAVITNLDVANEVFPVLRDRGLTLCMDDFGTGYSSLSYISKLPFEVIKIDKSFVDDILIRPEQLAMVKAVLSMARELGMRVVAEGIESDAQARELSSFACDYGQGYHFAKPLPATAASDWLRRHLQA